ncbi:DUF4931 domain-containing protein [Enterococcus florum]|uniref:DUF4931 domain-containing protein n=1 Tax=Enterococcus florum TaxID=2480627 RepID=A0A4P5P6N1_9ENTE|nr:DUF4931 domain-containing protein [Enterococcus florum]GCF93585.1 DUF4931 domain-containing protein [Enterococcus florum]
MKGKEEQQRPLIFSHAAAQGKPQHMTAEKLGCPFCDYAEEENVLKRSGEFSWVLNKYQTLEQTLQTIIIETNDHDADMSTYSREYNRSLLKFAFECWQEIKQDPRFRSVLLYKNHGPLSGGSLKHAHMQVVGLEDLDGEESLTDENFEGVEVLSDNGLTVNFSTQPIMGFLEINLITPAHGVHEQDAFADMIQKAVQFILNHYYKGRSESFNLFFFERGEKLIAKLTPRFMVSPYYVGYKISQTFTNDHLHGIRDEFRAFLKS